MLKKKRYTASGVEYEMTRADKSLSGTADAGQP